MHYSPSATVAVDESTIYFKTYNPMKSVKFGLKMFGYYTSPQLADELLRMNMVTTGTVMPSRKEMPEPLKMNKTVKMRQGDVL
jgi:hypothetical protein